MTLDSDGRPHKPAAFEKPHDKLRGSRKRNGDIQCSGSHESYKIQYELPLGHEAYTDVLELQLKTLAGAWLNDKTAALTLAVALRDALAELLGVQATELGCDSVCPQCVLAFDQRFAIENLDRHAALEILSREWLHALRLPEELAFFGPKSELEYVRLSEAVWRESLKGGVSRVRLFASGKAGDWDIGPSPLRHLAYRLAGQQQTVELLVPRQQIELAREEDRHLLASLADHPDVAIIGLAEIPRAGPCRVIAEIVRNDTATRWAAGEGTLDTFDVEWGTSEAPLIVAYDLPVLVLTGHAYTSDELRPPVDEGDRELVLQHELDGSLQGFGRRFWTLVADQHPATARLLEDEQAEVQAIRYSDRYLFTPLGIALLVELVDGLRTVVTVNRWDNPTVAIVTTDVRSTGTARFADTVWSDWPNARGRDQALIAAFEFTGIDTDLKTFPRSQAPHARSLSVEFSTGSTLTLRLDQGVSYWRAATPVSGQQHTTRFPFAVDDIEEQGRRLAEMALMIEGARHPTELFIKVR